MPPTLRKPELETLMWRYSYRTTFLTCACARSNCAIYDENVTSYTHTTSLCALDCGVELDIGVCSYALRLYGLVFSAIFHVINRIPATLANANGDIKNTLL